MPNAPLGSPLHPKGAEGDFPEFPGKTRPTFDQNADWRCLETKGSGFVHGDPAQGDPAVLYLEFHGAVGHLIDPNLERAGLSDFVRSADFIDKL